MDAAGRVIAYFEACNGAPAAAIAACFVPDAVIYDTIVPPVRGARVIGESVVALRSGWQGGRWSVDALVADGGPHVAIEWTLRGRRGGMPAVLRGSEHYRLAPDGRIEEIRQYWSDRSTGLNGYRYP
jgi:ketosteroid isomerase-like protein